MSYIEEINYRDAILSRVHNGGTILPEERLWLATHKIYNRKFKYPYLNTDIIQLKANTKYKIRIRLEHLAYHRRIMPIIAVPNRQGRIIAEWDVVDYKGEKSLRKSIKMLGVLIDKNRGETEFEYLSKLGLLSVSYQCDYYDDKQNIVICKNSDTGDSRFAMSREVLSVNKILYKCKIPDEDGFDRFAFSVEWEITE